MRDLNLTSLAENVDQTLMEFSVQSGLLENRKALDYLRKSILRDS